MYQAYRDRVEFFIVYIREAHPGSRLPGINDGKTIEQTNTLEERMKLAKEMNAKLKVTIPTIIDKEDNKANKAYAGWPERIIIVGVDGKIAYLGGPGPFGFKPGEAEKWLKGEVKEKSGG